ncbi:MAG: FeoA family protein [Rothia sp. (in: high G+C Gram-positive bacteria)]|nr:FeoA family protein [Rothia sp. (in: high G+C Gram-positive bacteria)]
MTLLPAAPGASQAKAGRPTLADARPEDSFCIAGFCPSADPILCQRLQDLGFRVGCTVQCLRRAPLGSPLMFRVCDTDLCLRKEQAALIHTGQLTLDQLSRGQEQ